MFTIHGISFSYKKDFHVFVNQTVTLPRNGLVELRGDNGVGKTTLLRILAGMLPVSNVELGEWRKNSRAALFDENILSTPMLTVDEYIEMVCARFLFCDNIPFLPLITTSMRNTYLNDLSLGQRKRLVLSVASLVTSGHAILLDEPFNGLDAESRAIAVELVKQMASKNLVIVATHDLPEEKVDVIYIDEGGVIESQYTEEE